MSDTPYGATPVTNQGSTGMTGPQPTRDQYLDQLSTAQLYAGHQRLHPMGHRNRDEALSEAITRVTTVAPWTRQAPRFVVDIANDALSTGSIEQAMMDVQDAGTFMATLKQREQLRRASPETQQEAWSKMDRRDQAALKAQGYLPPAEEEMRLARASFTPDGLPIAGIMDVAGKVAGATLGLVGGKYAREAGSWTWDRLTDLQNVPGQLYRLPRTGYEGVLKDPGGFLEAWRTARHGEKVFEPKVAQRVAETFDDPDAYQYVARLATGESVYDIAKEMADIGTPEYAGAVSELLDFAENPLVRDGLAALQNAHISPGRNLAKRVSLDPVEDKKLFTLVSGAGDFAFQWFADPTLIAGKFNKARLASRIGLTTVGGDVVNRVLSFYDEGLDLRAAARAVTDVTDKGYWRALESAALNPTERAAVVMADHVHQGQYSRLLQAMPGTSRLQPELEKLRTFLSSATPEQAADYFAKQGINDDLFTKLAAADPERAKMIEHLADYAREVPVVKPMDMVRFFSGETGMTALMRGDLAHYRYGFSTLPRLTRGGTIRTAAKIAVEDVIDFAADAHVRLREPILASDVAAGNLDAVQKGMVLLLSPMARAFQKVTTLLPAQGHIAFGSRESVQLFDQLLDYGVRGESRRELFDRFIKAGSEAEARNVVQSAYKTMFANAGLLDDPEMPSAFLDKWLKSANQRYALDNLDRLDDGTRAGIWPDADRAGAVAIPAFRDLLSEIRRQRFQRVQTGWGSPEFWQGALKIYEPVAAFPERFMRVWKPAVLIRPALPIRQGGEEAVNQFARLGPAHTLKQWLALPVAAKDPSLGALTRSELGAGDGLLGRLSPVERTSAGSEAHKVALGVENRLRKLASKFVTPEDVRAYREHLFVDTVAESFNEITGTRVGIQGSVMDEDPTIFASVNKGGGAGRVDFRKVNGMFDEHATADELGRLVLADTAGHVGRDRVARARLKVRSLYVDEGQAQRISGTLNLPGTSFEAVASVREQLAALPQPLRARLRAWVDGEDWTLSVDGAKTKMTNEDLGKAVVRDVAAGNRKLGQVVDDMKLLNGSDRRALLADPVTALDDVTTQDHWPDLLHDLQRGDADAWRQLEDEVAVARMSADDLYGHVKAMDRADAARFSELTPNERLQQWAVVQRKMLDQITLDDNGSVIHGITGTLADETFDGVRHVVDADYKLPTRVHGPELREVEGRKLTEKMVNGFFDWTGEVIRSIARQPLWQAAYANAYKEVELALSRYVRSPELEAGAARVLGKDVRSASDLFMELEHRMEEAFRSAPEAGGPRLLNDLDSPTLVNVLDAHGIKVDHADLGAVREWWASEREARAHLSKVSAQRATVDTIPYIDDHRIRSQAADMGRFISPFWFAQEQFYKRWARTFRQSPEALARLSKAHHALNAIGWIDRNEHGEEVFVYPGSAQANSAIAKFFEMLPGDAKYALPIAVPLTGQLTRAVPGFDDTAQLPAAGPLLALPMGVIRQVLPELGHPLEKALLPDQAQNRPLLSIVMPTSVMRLWNVATADDGDLAGATIAAMQLMEATGHGLPEGRTLEDGTFLPVTAGERQQYLDRLRNHARIIKLTQALVGMTGPASPSPDLNPEDLDEEFQKLLQSGIPIEEAVTRFMSKNPDATAWTVFATSTPGKAPTSPTAAALDSLVSNKEFFDKYRAVGAWLLPQTPPGSTEPFDRAAWREMLANDIRVRKTDEEMWRDIKFAEAATEFFDNKKLVDTALLDAGDNVQARKRISDYWSNWSQQYLAVHPVFAEDYQSNANHQRRVQTIKEVMLALDDPLAPKVAHAPQLRELVNNWEQTQRAIDESNAAEDHATDRQNQARKNMRAYFDNWAQGFVAGHPTIEAFYQRIIVPELGLPPATKQEEQQGG